MGSMSFLVASLAIVLLALAYVLNKHTAFFTYHLHKRRVKILRDLPYADDNNLSHALDVYLPKKTKDFPIVHFIYGGYWISGDKRYKQRHNDNPD